MSSVNWSEDVLVVPGYTKGDRIFIIVVFPLVGLLLGVGLQPLAEWASGVDTLPFGRISDVVATLDPWWAKAALAGVGLLAGAAFSAYALLETVTVTVTPGRLTLKRGDKVSSFEHGSVDTVFVDGKQVVVLDRHTAELAREPFEGDAQLLADSLRTFGYPWSDEDPHATAYRRWIDGAPELTDAEHFVLRTRANALSDDDKDEAADLRTELARIGLVVRDEGNRQYWRRTS